MSPFQPIGEIRWDNHKTLQQHEETIDAYKRKRRKDEYRTSWKEHTLTKKICLCDTYLPTEPFQLQNEEPYATPVGPRLPPPWVKETLWDNTKEVLSTKNWQTSTCEQRIFEHILLHYRFCFLYTPFILVILITMRVVTRARMAVPKILVNAWETW